MLSLIVAGGRNFRDKELLYSTLDSMANTHGIDEIVCGMARGADLLGKQYANDHLIKLAEFPANWAKFGKSAGYIRNKEMAKYANSLLAFWDGKSKGTKHMIDLAREYKLKVKVIYYYKEELND